jgi:cytochrome c553
MFLDALDRLAPIHLEWINSHEAFLAVLKVRFKHHGIQLIENGRFALQASKTKRDVNLNRPWEICLHPGQEYDMSMLFQDSSSPAATTCASCHHTNQGKMDEDITW